MEETEVRPAVCYTTVSTKETETETFLAQWLRTRLLMQGTWVQFLVREDSTCLGTAKTVSHNYGSLRALEPMHCNKRSHCNEKPTHHAISTTREGQSTATKTQHCQNKLIN